MSLWNISGIDPCMVSRECKTNNSVLNIDLNFIAR